MIAYACALTRVVLEVWQHDDPVLFLGAFGAFFLMGLTVRALRKPPGLLLGVVLGVGAPLLMSFSVLTVLGLKNSLVLLAGHSAALDATLGRMRAEHFSHEADAPRAVIGPVLHRQLARDAATLETDLEEHLRFEEFELFPFLDEALPATTQERIIQELRAGRRTRV